MATGSGGPRSRSGSRSGGRRTTAKRTTSKRSGGASSGRSTASRSSTAAAGRADKSVEAFRDALERSVTLSRDRLQDVVDDAVKRGRMTRDDANELVANLVTRSRRYSDDDIDQLHRIQELTNEGLNLAGVKRVLEGLARAGGIRASNEASATRAVSGCTVTGAGSSRTIDST